MCKDSDQSAPIPQLISFLAQIAAPVAQLVQRWPADLAVPGLSPACGGDLFSHKRGVIAHNISLSTAERPDMSEILLKNT